MKLHELFAAEGPLINKIGQQVGTKVGQTAKGVGAVAGAAAGLGGRFLSGFQAGRAGKDDQEKIGAEDTAIDQITKVIDKNELARILDSMIASKPLDGYQTRLVTKSLPLIQDANFKMIFSAVLKGRQLSQQQINNLQTMKDGI